MKTTLITLPNKDSKIWNLEYKVIDIIESLVNGNSVVVHLNNEGICTESVGLYKLLDSICDKFNIDPARISILTANALEKSSKYRVNHSELVYLAKEKHTKFVSNKQFDHAFKHFGIFIGRSNWNRLFLASTLFKNFKDKTLLSFHYNADTLDGSGFDELALLIGVNDANELCHDLLRAFPIKLDDVKTYPVLSPAYFNILNNYNNIFLDVVCETYFTGNTFYPTEKTVRPIIANTPFLVFGPKDYLSNLRKLGFRTFSDYWSEDYDNHSGVYRAQEIQKIISDLSNKSTSELNTMYNTMSDIFEHNQTVLKSMSINKFYNTFK